MKRKGLSLRRWLCSRGRGGSTFVLAGRGDLRLEAASGGGVLSPHSQAFAADAYVGVRTPGH
jgi:hypothetical protein